MSSRTLVPTGENSPLYRQVEAYIEQYIADHALKVGDAIPTLDEVGQTLGVSNITVRRGVNELVRKGVLTTRQGAGTHVARKPGKRILWVSGVHLDQADMSRFHVDLFAMAMRFLREHKSTATLHLTTLGEELDAGRASKWRDFDAVVFAECQLENSLVRQVRTTGQAYAEIAMRAPGTPNAFSVDVTAADHMALTELRRRGHEHASVLALGYHREPRFVQASKAASMPLTLGMVEQTAASGSHVEEAAYELACEMIQNDDLGKAVYVTDDIIARGLTRAVLAHGDEPASYDIITFVARQEIIDLGMPVTHITYDLSDRVRAAVGSVVAQMAGEQRLPVTHFSALSLVRSDDPSIQTVKRPLTFRVRTVPFDAD